MRFLSKQITTEERKLKETYKKAVLQKHKNKKLGKRKEKSKQKQRSKKNNNK